MFDYIIQHAEIIDGTGKPRYQADLAIKDEKIAEIAPEIPVDQAGKVIDAKGKTIVPGFIDIHSHTDCSLFVNPRSESKIRQGVTTDVSGNCGYSPFPIKKEGHGENYSFMKEHKLEIDWENIGGFYQRLESQGIGTNYASFIGHGSLRAYCMGYEKRPATPKELDYMKSEMEKSMEQGALGLTTGLIYPPGCFAAQDEIVEIAKVAAKKGGIYASHMRSEGKMLMEAITETLSIGRKANIPVQVSHLKAAGKKNWGKGKWAIEMIEIARQAGIEVHADRYPYSASSTDLSTLLPDWAHDGGNQALLNRLRDAETKKRLINEIIQNVGQESGYEDTLIAQVKTEANRKYEGMQLQAIAADRKQSIPECICDFLLEEDGEIAAIFFSMNDEETDLILSQPFISIGSDSGARAPYPPLNLGKPHPRSYGTFPRVLHHYAKEKHLFTIEEAVRKMTGLSAEILHLKDRGTIEKNKFADLLVLSLSKVKDTATFMQPHQYPLGFNYIFVNGKLVVEEGIHTGTLAGKVLRN